jgi:hypothetical protein
MRFFYLNQNIMKRFIICLPAFVVLLTSCSSKDKKVMVLTKGKTEVNQTTNTITIKNGSGSNEEMLELAAGKVDVKIITPEGEKTVSLTDAGYYIINAKADTVIGSYQNFINPSDVNRLVSEDKLARSIDSLKLLLVGQNVNATNRNYFITPYAAVKITDNREAFIIAPYHQMKSVEKVDGKAPDVFRFWGIDEVRATLKNLEEVAAPVKVPTMK